MKTETAPAAEKAEPTVEKAHSSVELLDAAGASIGVIVRLKDAREDVEPEDGEDRARTRLRSLAKSITGWSSMHYEGEPYPFSQERALALFQRHPHFADQVERALKKASA